MCTGKYNYALIKKDEGIDMSSMATQKLRFWRLRFDYWKIELLTLIWYENDRDTECISFYESI